MSMETMTAEQIENALKPMRDFAPAVLAAAEIVRAAHVAEKALPALQQQAQDLTSSISHLTDARSRAQQELANMREEIRVLGVDRDAVRAEKIAEESAHADVRTKKEQAEQALKELHARLVQA
jgi:chromosome segregation ATPase